jgi:hypothetical protein
MKTLEKTEEAIKNGQSKMGNPDVLATPDTHDSELSQTKRKNTT